MYTNVKDEIIIKIVGKLTQEFPEVNQIQVREIVETVLYRYDITPQETALIASDIEDRIQIYIASKRLDGLSEKTLKNYNYELIKFASCLTKPIATVTTMDLRMYLSVRCKNMKGSSTNALISILKSFFGWLYNEEYIPKNPAVKLKQTKEPKRVRHALTDEEVELLRQACWTKREFALVEFLVSTGCRLSEVVGINVSDIDWHDMSLLVIGKGNKQRKVYFNVKTKILLQAYLKDKRGNDPALFTSVRFPFARVGGRAIERELKNISQRAGFEKSIFPHLMRHTFATHNINSGMPLHVIQQLMGHESPQTTLVYSELSSENIKHEYRKIS